MEEFFSIEPRINEIFRHYYYVVKCVKDTNLKSCSNCCYSSSSKDGIRLTCPESCLSERRSDETSICYIKIKYG